MLRVTEAELSRMEERWPGIREQVIRLDAANLPACPICGSDDTASVQVGVVGRLIEICCATSKVSMVANGSTAAKYSCNSCRESFK